LLRKLKILEDNVSQQKTPKGIDTAGQVRSGEELDLNSLNPWLQTNIGNLSGQPKVTQYSGGASNWTYCLAYPEREVILRRGPAGTKAKGAHDMGREFRLQLRTANASTLRRRIGDWG
jgi:hypothetical protein